MCKKGSYDYGSWSSTCIKVLYTTDNSVFAGNDVHVDRTSRYHLHGFFQGQVNFDLSLSKLAATGFSISTVNLIGSFFRNRMCKIFKLHIWIFISIFRCPTRCTLFTIVHFIVNDINDVHFTGSM